MSTLAKRSLALWLCAVGFFPLAALAGVENFVLALTPAGKDGEGVSFIVTSAQTFNSSRPGFTFNGSLAEVNGGGYRLDYLLETTTEHGATIHTGASVVLTPGEPVQLVKNGDQFYNLRLDRYPPVAEAGKPAGPSSGGGH